MSIINNANKGSQINLLCLIFRVISRNNGVFSANEIIEFCRPENLPETETAKKRFSENLQFWMEDGHQLWFENADSKLELRENPKTLSPHAIADIVNRVLLRPQVENILGEAGSRDTVALLQLLSCFLVSDLFSISSGKDLEPEMRDVLSVHFPDVKSPNLSEGTIFLQYGRFLGYFETIQIENRNISILDPTRVVKHSLPSIFEENSELDAETFIARLGEVVPLLDGGNYWTQALAQFKNTSSQMTHRQISKSLSIAIARLRVEREIEFTSLSDDASAFSLQLPEGEKSISRFKYISGG